MNGFRMLATGHLGDAQEKAGLRNGLYDPFHGPPDTCLRIYDPKYGLGLGPEAAECEPGSSATESREDRDHA